MRLQQEFKVPIFLVGGGTQTQRSTDNCTELCKIRLSSGESNQRFSSKQSSYTAKS